MTRVHLSSAAYLRSGSSYSGISRQKSKNRTGKSSEKISSGALARQSLSFPIMTMAICESTLYVHCIHVYSTRVDSQMTIVIIGKLRD